MSFQAFQYGFSLVGVKNSVSLIFYIMGNLKETDINIMKKSCYQRSCNEQNNSCFLSSPYCVPGIVHSLHKMAAFNCYSNLACLGVICVCVSVHTCLCVCVPVCIGARGKGHCLVQSSIALHLNSLRQDLSLSLELVNFWDSVAASHRYPSRSLCLLGGRITGPHHQAWLFVCVQGIWTQVGLSWVSHFPLPAYCSGCFNPHFIVEECRRKPRWEG